MIDRISIRRALISVYDKRELLALAKVLQKFAVEIISTGGTATFLQQNQIPVISVSQVTHFQEILGGRVKTLHPNIHGAILAKRDDADQMQQLRSLGITPIDMVVVNLYPFEKTVARADVELAEALENIDIGGPCMIRAAAKNYPAVAVLTDPSQYAEVIKELSENDGQLSLQTRATLAVAAFQRTCQYDYAIQGYLNPSQGTFPDTKLLKLTKVQDLRYGENPHQLAAFYRDENEPPFGEQLHGKELSFNNILDIHSAMGLASEFAEPCVVIVKHNNPCGVAVGGDISEAYDKALQTDPVSAFGGIVAANQAITGALAGKLSELFLEVVVAPEFSQEALQVLQTKKNLRLIRWPQVKMQATDIDVKKVLGGYLLQTVDVEPGPTDFSVVSKRPPTEAERQAMRFGWKVAKWVKSNAIVFVAPDRTLAIGAGQMSRVDAAKMAILKAKSAGLDLKGSVVISDAFFPFRDGIDVAAEAGATAVIEPGGSVRDEEVIKAADEHGMALVFTGIRHFRH